MQRSLCVPDPLSAGLSPAQQIMGCGKASSAEYEATLKGWLFI